MLNIYAFSRLLEILEIGLYKQVFMNRLIVFLVRDNKTKLVPASFACFLDFF